VTPTVPIEVSSPVSAAARPVGIVGLGQMGFGMARNLLKAGHDVLAYDVAPEPLARFTAAGGRAARRPAQIGAECDRVVIMVVDGAQVEAVLAGRDGLLDTMRAGTVMVCSTIALAELRAVAERAAAGGVTLIDCPVSGGVTGAEAGTLTLLCGGDPAAFEAQRPLLSAMGSQVWRARPGWRRTTCTARSAPAPRTAGSCARSRGRSCAASIRPPRSSA